MSIRGIWPALGVLLLGLSATLATAQQQLAPVELSSQDGRVRISGNLISYEDGVYIIDTERMGRLKLADINIICEGLLCPVPTKPVSPEFGIHGSRTVGTTLIPNLLEAYAASVGASYEISATDDPAERIVRLTNQDGSVRALIDLQTRGSGSAFPGLATKAAEIGVADRRMKDSDATKLAAAGIDDLRDTASENVLGLDGIVLITHKDNPVRNLSSDEVARIWSGEIDNWSVLGGGDFPIKVNSFGEGSGDRAIVIDRLVTPFGREEQQSVTRWKSYQDMVDAVMADRGGIGFVGRWLASVNDVQQVAIREACGLLSPPTDFRMKIEGYALSRRLYAYTRPGPMHPEAQAFLDWTKTPAAQPVIRATNFIDRSLERMRLEDMGMALIHTAAVEPDFDGAQFSSMMYELRGADRLSTSFRFNTGSAVLDVESQRNIGEMAELLTSSEFDGLEVLLVGFADSVGAAGRNTQLALNRANAVRRTLLQELDPEDARRLALTPMSFGELMPLSCNDTEIGRERNRRVEVWLRVPNSRSILR